MTDQKTWYLRKQDGTDFGPVTLAELQRWAAECRLVAGNQVSQDREEWLPVEELTQLGMEWVARREDGREYGPFNIKAVGELYRHGVLPAGAMLCNERSDETVALEVALRKLGERASAQATAADDAAKPSANEPAVDADGDDDEAPAAPATPAAGKTARPRKAASATTGATAASASEAGDGTPAEADAGEHALRAELTACREETSIAIAGLTEERDTARAAVKELQQKLKQATAESKQARAALDDLTTDRDAARTQLATLEAEAADRQQTLAEQAESLRTELARLEAQATQAEALQEELDRERVRARKLAESLQEAQRAAKEATDQARKATQALADATTEAKTATDGLAKQLAFTKKNNDTLQGELDDARRYGSRMTRAFVVLAGGVLLVVSAMLLFGHGCGRNNDEGPVARPPSATPALAPPAHPPKPPTTPPRIASTGTAPVRTVGAPPSSPRTLAPWPEIRIEGVAVRQDSNTCVLVFDEGVFARMTTLSTWGKEVLSAVAHRMDGQWDRFSMVIEGHTDNEPMRATELHPDNYHLGLARAQAVVELLTQDRGVPASALRATSTGDSDPPHPNDTAENRRRNRTVVLKLKRNTP